jgi:hypothetical protein
MGEIRLLTESELTWMMAEKLRKVWNAWVRLDESAHDELLAEDYRAVYPNGTVRSGRPSTAEMTAQRIEDYWLTELQAWPVGAEAAIVTYVAEVQQPEEMAAQKFQFLVGEVWVKRGGKWKCRYYHATMAK